ncbi:hypothetical protein [Catenovulum sediminis]|uniref:Uncharacterized protein n=1 Tax=Catenovulum sediminis TaxID=1740262 RepID=A0ABV1RC71_9ALTE
MDTISVSEIKLSLFSDQYNLTYKLPIKLANKSPKQACASVLER